jgi:hypothetical protein
MSGQYLPFLCQVRQSEAALEPNVVIFDLDLHITGRFNPIP